jgi:hypothetical protein
MNKRQSNKWRVFKQLDIYSRPVNLTLKGERFVKSKFGAFISSLLWLTLIGLLVYKIHVMVERGNTKL